MASGDYVRACQTVAAGKKVKAFGLVNCPLPVLKKLHRAGINIATLELSGPLGLLEAADTQALLAYCNQHGIKVGAYPLIRLLRSLSNKEPTCLL